MAAITLNAKRLNIKMERQILKLDKIARLNCNPPNRNPTSLARNIHRLKGNRQRNVPTNTNQTQLAWLF